MVKLLLEDIVGSGKGKTAVVCAHGPSLNEHKDEIIKLQKENKIVRFSPNNWFNFFDTEPNYWVLASNVDTISAYYLAMNRLKSEIIFADSVDLTPYDFIEKNLEVNYLGYDQRHFKGHRCLEILSNFKKHHDKHKKFDFTYYGENSSMWSPPFSGTPGGVDIKGRCCHRIEENRKTIQEFLQQVSGHEKHYSTGCTVSLHMLAIAIIMGFKNIYVSGLDLDYSLGYANKDIPAPEDFWKNSPETLNLKNDLQIIEESAKMSGVKILNLYKKPWYGIFTEAEKITAD
jgi:hypothetical protein